MNIQEIRQQYPQYEDLSDEQLAQGLHKKFYADMPYAEFSQKIGLVQPVAQPQQPQRTTGQELGRQLGLTARYGAEGIAALPIMVGDAANALLDLGIGGVNRVAGTNIPKFGSASQSFQGLLNQAGLPQPEGAQERVVGDISRAMAGGGGTAALGQRVGGAVGNVLATKPGMQMLSAGSGAGASGLVREEGGGPGAQIAAGLAGSLAAPVAADLAMQSAKGLWRGIPAAVKPFTKSGQQQIAGRVLSKLASDRTMAAQALQSVDETIPGSQPTTAQASRDYGLLTAERGLASSSPQAGARFAERFAAQNKARETLLGSMAQDKASVEAARIARDEAALPLLAEAKKSAKPANIEPIVNKIDDILSGESGERDVVVQALTSVKKKLFDPNGTPKTDITRLYGIRKHINDLLDGRLSGEAANAKMASRELISIRDALDDQLGEAAPQFKQYLQSYKQLSKPINQMETLQDIATRTINAGTTATGENILSQAKWFNVVTKNRDELSQVLKPEQMNALEIIGRDLDMGALSVSGGKAAGSNTFQNLSTANIVGSMIGGGMPDAPLFQTITRPMAWVYKVPDEQVRELLVDAMLDPKLASKLMAKATPGNVVSLSTALKNRATALGLGTAQSLRVQNTPPPQRQERRQQSAR